MRLKRVYVIGMGEVGTRLAAALREGGTEVVPVTRDAGWDEAVADTPGLRLVCVREELLLEVVGRLRHLGGERLAFVQNGWIRPLLEDLPTCTRALIWFTSKGDFYKPLRPTPFCGPVAAPLAAACEAASIPAVAVGDEEFAALDAEKMGFNCVVGLPLAVHGLSLGEYLDRMTGEAESLFAESVAVCAAAVGARAKVTWWAEFLRVVEPLAWVKTSSAKALEYRNGAVLRLARELRAGVPVTERLLNAVGYEN